MSRIHRRPTPPTRPEPPTPPEVVITPPVEPAKPPKPPKPTTTLGSYGNASIDQWDRAFIAASEAVKKKKGVTVNPRIIKGMMDVETGGNGNYAPDRCRPKDGTDSVPACGPMQIKFDYHRQRCPDCDLKTVAGQIELATHIIGDFMTSLGVDEYHALVAPGSYFPTDDVNGTTQGSYVGRVKKLVAAMEKDAGGTTPAPKPKPVQDPIRVIVGGNYPPIDYGFGSDVGLHFYDFGVGHGLSRGTQHTGYDVGVPRGTPLFTPINGVVECVGNRGTPRWGQGCGAYADSAGGTGNITIYDEDAGVKLTLGHTSAATVTPGQRVTAGQRVGTSGGYNGDHVHVETSVERNGTYWLVDPGPALREAMGGEPVVTYAERVPVPQPSEWDDGALVTVTQDGVKVLQRAREDADEVAEPLKAGESFRAVMQVWVPEEQTAYWVSRSGARVPLPGTACASWPDVPSS